MSNMDKQTRMAHAIRFLSMDAVEKAKSGHPGLPMGAADIATVLFTKFMKFDPTAPKWADRDRFVLSAGHGSMLLYSLLHLLGYEDMSIEDLQNFRQIGAKTAGHPEFGHACGIETTTGPLGQGLANAVGMAIAEKALAAQFGSELVDHYTYVLAGDGCLMEGISQEALSLAGHLKLNKLILLWDDNNVTIDGAVSVSDSTNQLDRFKASGWNTDAIDGHDHSAIEKAIAAAQKSDKPTIIACKTTIGFGAPNKGGTSSVHGAPLGAAEIAATREALGWENEPFDIPSDIRDAWRIAGLNAAHGHKEWQKRFEAADSELSAEFERRMRGDLPSGFEDAMAAYKKELAAEPKNVATRKASEMALNVINGVLPETVGGSADLTGSNNTKTSHTVSITPDDFSGRYMNWGIREHVMASAMNGMALHGGVIPYGGTFLVFADYMRGAMRLSALMEQRVVYVLTHDSIGLGEDGPTHQPVETLASLRAIPNMQVFRPADVYETAECWEVAIQSEHNPSVLSLTRQGLEPVRTEYSDDNLSARGAYLLSDCDGEADVSIFASGSEIEVAMAAQKALAEQDIQARVISVPCFELFEKQSANYQRETLGSAKVNVAIEAAIRMGWDRFIGSDGIFVGMDSFGASGPYKELYEKFGITAENVVALVAERLKTS
ncbi:transketolase [Cohaesibacter sp. CAU 1516]|uniref:transketolase n=1 Tax=Cohaesibacter sp. CAU 1516 TaxID=2576038 RepID=UPI0010FE2E11|nr:transketolase [Cohaesibacter sp. CAU 1516]TLP43016.1 transketolase [Cohaesibacter sp. CAU 1516]